MLKTNGIDWQARAERVGKIIEERADALDREGRFAAENYRDLAEAGLISFAVPQELGGGGASHAEVCQTLRVLGRACSSTALALSMHTHLVAAAVWRHLHGLPAEALLRRVANEQIVLVSTGAGDWLESHGEVQRTEGGYLVTAIKRCASGSPLGDLLLSSAPYVDPQEGPLVLHFGVPFNTPGVSVIEDWDSLGMRASGSNSVQLRSVFVPDAAISVKRPRKGWHPVWSVILTVAPPIYMAPYLGLAERAVSIARQAVRARLQHEPDVKQLLLIGEMENAVLSAELAFEAGIENANNYAFSPDLSRVNRGIRAKTLLSQATRLTVDKAMEAVGGAAYQRVCGLERLWRDVRAGSYHALSEKTQQEISGRLALGLSATSEGASA